MSTKRDKNKRTKAVVQGQKRHKEPKTKVVKPKAQWYEMVAFFDGPAKAVMKINGEDVLLAGWVPPDNDVAIVLVPPSVNQEQGLGLEKILEAQFRKPVMVLTNNVQLVRLKPLTEGKARELMKVQEGGSLLQFTRPGPEDADKKEPTDAK